VTLLLLIGAESQAMVFGIRYTNTQEQALKGLSGVADPSTKGRFGMYVGQESGNSTFLVGLNYDRFKMNRGDSLLYSRRLTIDIGYRYQLIPVDQAKAMSFMPFLAIHFFKSYSNVKADSAILRPADVTYLKDISNDDGAWVSVGAEYFFAPVFSLGAEGGLRYTRANSTAYGYDIHIREYNTFVAILLSFWFGQHSGSPTAPPPSGD
jgi:hypothetical protein